MVNVMLVYPIESVENEKLYFDVIELLFAVFNGDDRGIQLFGNVRFPLSQILQNASNDGLVLLELG